MNKKLKQMKKRLCAVGMVIAAAGVSVPAAIGALPVESVYAANEVEINETNFPDEYFRSYILDNIDTNKDGKLSRLEIMLTEQLQLDRSPLASLKGVEFFGNLKYLYCWGCDLTELDVSKNTKLYELQCGDNDLGSLDVSNNKELAYLSCYGDELDSIDVSQNIELISFECGGNNFSSIDVSHNLKLVEFGCSGNKLDNLDVSKNKELSSLYCSHNNLTTLNLSNNNKLSALQCKNNHLCVLDLSHANPYSRMDPQFLKKQTRHLVIHKKEIPLTDLDPNLKAENILNLEGASLKGENFADINDEIIMYDYKTGQGDTTMQVFLEIEFVPIDVEGIELSADNQSFPVGQTGMITLNKGNTKKINAKVQPDNATYNEVYWSSSNTGVAKVDNNGNVTAVNWGTATITAKTSNGKAATCTVTVEEKDTRTGVYNVNRQWVYLKNGKQDTTFTGLAKAASGKWYHVTKGKYNPTYTGLSRAASGKWYYVKKGKYDTSFTGLAKAPSGKWYHVTKGKYDSTYTGLSKAASGKWYYVRKGKYDTSYTGLAKAPSGKLYYVTKGKYNTKYNGKAIYNNKQYTVVNGRVK